MPVPYIIGLIAFAFFAQSFAEQALKEKGQQELSKIVGYVPYAIGGAIGSKADDLIAYFGLPTNWLGITIIFVAGIISYFIFGFLGLGAAISLFKEKRNTT